MVALSTGDPDLAEDCAQEAMARAAARWVTVSRMDRPDRWVIRVAGRLAIDAWCKRRRETRLDAGVPTVPPVDAIQRLWVAWGLEQLSPSDRLLLILRHRDGLSPDEIAEHVGRTPATVAVYLKRARRRLRQVLIGDDV